MTFCLKSYAHEKITAPKTVLWETRAEENTFTVTSAGYILCGGIQNGSKNSKKQIPTLQLGHVQKEQKVSLILNPSKFVKGIVGCGWS